jgi:prevent-host-death family protein
VGIIVDKPVFSRDQLMSTRDAARKFGMMKKAAKEKPIFITDNGEVEFVLLDIEAYEEMYQRLSELESEVLEYRAEEAEREPETLVEWRSVRRSKTKV